MREIKFRVWDGRRMRFQEEGHSGSNGFVEFVTIWTGYEYSYEWADYKLMQFTGLKDKNGKDIYESDILQDAVGRVWLIDYHGQWGSFVFYWKGDKSRSQPYTRFHSNQKPLEVIGNIYENPELMESGQ